VVEIQFSHLALGVGFRVLSSVLRELPHSVDALVASAAPVLTSPTLEN